MKTLLLGAAIGALLVPAALVAPASAQEFSAQSDQHECVDDACTLVSLFQTTDAPASGYQGTTAPKYGTKRAGSCPPKWLTRKNKPKANAGSAHRANWRFTPSKPNAPEEEVHRPIIKLAQ